jgi:galactokinase
MASFELINDFRQLFHSEPAVYQAPGRVNLIGEFTDFNGGFVLPAAIDFCAQAAVARRVDRKLAIYSANYQERVEFDLDNLPAQSSGHWSDYVAGVARILAQRGHALKGANLLLAGDVPQGAGLSSSAAVEVVTGFALLDLAERGIDLRQLALACQATENDFVGARCGIMDQFISCHGEENKALLLDCRSLEYRALPLPADARLVICNTLVKHSIAGGEYNQRRAECEEGVRLLQKHLPAAQSLRDVTPADFERLGPTLPEVIRRRCRHVIYENHRTEQAANALEKNDLAAFGALMAQSHNSLRDDFEVSCAELDLLVELAGRTAGVYGSRMTGGGFGGCSVNLVKAQAVAEFQDTISDGFARVFKYRPEIYICAAANGVGRVIPN